MTIRNSTPADSRRVVDIWRRAVDATHHFLSPADRRDIEAEVVAFLPAATLQLLVDQDDTALGFMLVDGNRMEALFVDPACHRRGIGRALVEHALRDQPHLETDVNEQNEAAIRFYERMGFVRFARSARDGQGRAYPLLHLRHAG